MGLWDSAAKTFSATNKFAAPSQLCSWSLIRREKPSTTTISTTTAVATELFSTEQPSLETLNRLLRVFFTMNPIISIVILCYIILYYFFVYRKAHPKEKNEKMKMLRLSGIALFANNSLLFIITLVVSPGFETLDKEAIPVLAYLLFWNSIIVVLSFIALGIRLIAEIISLFSVVEWQIMYAGIKKYFSFWNFCLPSQKRHVPYNVLQDHAGAAV